MGACPASRKLAFELGAVSFSAVPRVWCKDGLRHICWNGTSLTTPALTKAANVISLYLNPPAHAAVSFCVDWKTAIQALDRKDHRLPRALGRAESQQSDPRAEIVGF